VIGVGISAHPFFYPKFKRELHAQAWPLLNNGHPIGHFTDREKKNCTILDSDKNPLIDLLFTSKFETDCS
tara:strand:+ start:415 stop:624 length:210 start_codon:yes stop_codon:yes gene_type:complete